MPMGWAAIGPRRRIRWPTTAPARPKPAMLVRNPVLRGKVEAGLATKCSAEQIAGRLKVEFPDQPEMQVSTETIYQSLYV
jgi:transposase, IS30 family